MYRRVLSNARGLVTLECSWTGGG